MGVMGRAGVTWKTSEGSDLPHELQPQGAGIKPSHSFWAFYTELPCKVCRIFSSFTNYLLRPDRRSNPLLSANKTRHGSWPLGLMFLVKGTQNKQAQTEIRDLYLNTCIQEQVVVSSRKEIKQVMALDKVFVEIFIREKSFGLKSDMRRGQCAKG